MKQYENPSLELIRFEEDIVTMSFSASGENELPGDDLFGANK